MTAKDFEKYLEYARAMERGEKVEVRSHLFAGQQEIWMGVGDVRSLMGCKLENLRMKAKLEPVMPKGIFYVRMQGTAPAHGFLPVRVTEVDLTIMIANARPEHLGLVHLNRQYLWSRDRVTWHTFDSEEARQ